MKKTTHKAVFFNPKRRVSVDVPLICFQVILTYKMVPNEERPLVDLYAGDADSKMVDAPQEKTVILWGRENILGSVVENLLDSLKLWKVIRFSDDHNESAIIGKIRELNPGVVIIYKKERLVEIQLLIQLLDECPGLKIITVNPESNSVQIYNKQRVWIKNSEDFLSMLEG